MNIEYIGIDRLVEINVREKNVKIKIRILIICVSLKSHT